MLTFVKLIAIKPLTGDYGHVSEGQAFETDSRSALSLQRRGLARPDRESRRASMQEYMYQHGKALPEYTNKSISPLENKHAVGIGDHADEKPAAVRRTVNPVLSRSNVSVQRTRDPG